MPSCTRPRRRAAWGVAATLGLLLGAAPMARAAGDVTVPGTKDFPESVTAGADGTLYFSSFAGGRIFRAAPGAAEASEWIKQGSNGLASVIGILADPKAGVLYACSSDMSWAGLTIPTGGSPTSVKVFDLATGAPRGSLALPPSTLGEHHSFCNDMALGPDGSLYATDSLAGHVLRRKPGADAFEVWARDPRWEVDGFELDGIAVAGDAVYVNIFDGDGLYRIAIGPDGGAGAITKLRTSRPLYHADGLRALDAHRLLMVEGETRGTLDLITLDGDAATVTTLRDGFDGPVSLIRVGGTVYVLDDPLRFLFDPVASKQTPPPFTARAVPFGG